jgi:hypothetical protein
LPGSEISGWITETERKWLPSIREKCASLFEGVFLPSHDLQHHQRVWNYARELLAEVERINPFMTKALVEGLFFACWFHDTGMAEDRGPAHGSLGRKRCGEYFMENSVPGPPWLDEALNAIELHDSKEKPVYRTLTKAHPPGILELLSVADDMDAFGITGIYRYAEISLHRGVKVEDLGVMVLKNAEARFSNVTGCCVHFPAILERIAPGYQILRSYFNSYNHQLAACAEPDLCREGHLGIVNHIKNHSVLGNTPPGQLHSLVEEAERTVFLYRFFLNLKSVSYSEIDSSTE